MAVINETIVRISMGLITVIPTAPMVSVFAITVSLSILFS
jgi:hypothetical protein